VFIIADIYIYIYMYIGLSTKMADVELQCIIEFQHKSSKRCDFHRFLLVISATNRYQLTNLEPGDEFWNRVWVLGSWYKLLVPWLVFRAGRLPSGEAISVWLNVHF